MKYLTTKETALRWNVSTRTVNALCTQGRIRGAVKLGTVWAIPEDAEKPDDPRRERKKQTAFPPEAASEIQAAAESRRVAMPLLNTAFPLGSCMESIRRIEDPDLRSIALAEYYYFTGQAEQAAALAEPYLRHEDIALRVSACWLYTYANLVGNQTNKSMQAMKVVREMMENLQEDAPPREKAYTVSVYTGASVLLHLPVPKILVSLKTYIHMMPPGLRLFVLYIEAHHAYLNRQYGVAIGIAETALALESEIYPIPSIYLHLIACVGYLNMKHPEMAKEHAIEAWKIAQPDGFIHPIAEHHGLVGGTLEATLKRLCPNDFKHIIALTNKYSAGWRKLHNQITGNHIADNLTTTEFAAAMLAARNWTNQEIADHMGLSEYTVRHYISTVLQKLNISHRKALSRFLL